MTNFFESELFEPIDLCSCFDPIFDPPPEQVAAWNFSEPEPTLENTSFYVTDPDGTEYFYCGGTRIKISERFTSQGKEWSTLWRMSSSLRPGLPDTPDCFRQQILAKTLIPAHTYGTIKLEAW